MGFAKTIDKRIKQSPIIEHAEYWLGVIAQMEQREQRVFRKIISLARDEINRPIHIIMSMAKAKSFSKISLMAHAIIQYRLQMAVAKFWDNQEKLRCAEEQFKGFLVACDVFSKGLSIEASERKRRFTIVKEKPSCQKYEGKSVPLRFGTPLRNNITAFKMAH